MDGLPSLSPSSWSVLLLSLLENSPTYLDVPSTSSNQSPLSPSWLLEHPCPTPLLVWPLLVALNTLTLLLETLLDLTPSMYSWVSASLGLSLPFTDQPTIKGPTSILLEHSYSLSYYSCAHPVYASLLSFCAESASEENLEDLWCQR